VRHALSPCLPPARRTALVLLAATVTLVGIPAVTMADPAPGPAAGQCALDTATSQVTPSYIASAPTAATALDVKDAWTRTRGAGVTVAVVDSGVDADNAHLAGAVLPGADLVDPTDTTAGRTDIGGLGTAVAGMIAARSVPSSGLLGLAPAATILPVRVYEQTDGQDVPTPGTTAAGIVWAAAHGAQIIVVPTPFTHDDDGVLQQAVAQVRRAGSLVIAPVGDAAQGTTTTDTAPRYPAAYTDDVLGVTGVDGTGSAASGVVQNDSVQLALPVAGIVSTYYDLGDCQFTADPPGDAPLTSLATGYAAGLAALVAAAYPQETPAQWAYRLLVTASRPQPAQRDNVLGWGVADPVAALAFVDDGAVAGPADPWGAAPSVRTTPTPQPPAAPASPPLPRRDRVVLAACVGLATVTALVALLLSSQRRQPRPAPDVPLQKRPPRQQTHPVRRSHVKP